MDIQNVKHIRTVSTNSTDDLEREVNKLLQSGDYVLLHFGFDVTNDDNGRVITPTIVVLGSEKPEPPQPQVIIRTMKKD